MDDPTDNNISDSLGSLGLGLVVSSPSPPPASSSPQLIHQSETKAIYRLYDTGYKVLLSPDPSADFAKLVHEQNISNFLPLSCRKRKVIDVTTFNERPALRFQWASGITLKEWIKKVENGPPVDQIVQIRAAMAIAKTLSDFHDGGVVYNKLTPDNIVLAPVEGEYVATLIDLSCALIYRDGGNNICADDDPAHERPMKDADLKSLGVILNQLFRGGESTALFAGEGSMNDQGSSSDDVDVDPLNDRRKRGKQETPGEGLPLYLSSLISALMDTSTPSEQRYKSVMDVYLDLKTLANSGAISSNILDEFTMKSRLRLPSDLFYGRQVQMSMLLHLFQTSVAIGSRPLMAIISGYPGTGKSTLVSQVKKPLVAVGGCFVEGKFDKSARPDTLLASALDAFFGKILESNTGKMEMKWRIQNAIGPVNNNVLLELLPNLQKWMTDGGVVAEAPSSSVKAMGFSQRLKYMFCKLIGAIACRSTPLILFLDDLQWADDMTLDIIRMLMTDPDIHHFLFLGCYRADEVTISHPLTAKLNAIQEQGVSVVTIKIGPIEKECVNTLLSEVLCLPPSLCRPLSTVIHSKTGGIIMFILRFLTSLNDDGDLWFNLTSRRWMYNREQIELKEIHGDVVSHMTQHMKNLSDKMRMGLKVAACLGPYFDAQVLSKAARDDETEDTFLSRSVEFGFLQKVGSNKYKWQHDQIQQAAYDLIPLQDRETFHLLLGSRLYTETAPSEMPNMIFFIVDSMNRGVRLIDDTSQKYEIAQLNLDAGEKALSGGAFQSASMYFKRGLSLLGPDSWDVKYKLTIRLYDAASEALFVTGDFSGLADLIDKSMTRSFEDKLNINNNFVRALAASSKFEQGITKCLGILNQLGEVIPTEITPEVFAGEVNQVKELLHGKSRQELLSLPIMTEAQKLSAMQFMNHAVAMTFIAKPLMNPILVFRMVKMSIEHGICNISAFAFACYGAWLVSDPDTCDVEGAHSMGRVATEMMKRLGAVEMIPRLYVPVYGFINIWKEPWQACLNKHLEAYESGATSGDMEYALSNLYQYVIAAVYCGDNLEGLSQSIESYAKRAFQCNHRTAWTSLVVLHQLSLDLMGIERNAYLPYSSGLTEETCLAHCRSKNMTSVCRLIVCKKKYVNFFEGDLDTASEMYELGKNFPLGSTGRSVGIMVSIFIDGLIGFFFARKHGDDETKWTNIGLDALNSLRKWVQSSEWNFSNKLYLLEAEYYFLRGDHERAIAFYNASIKAAHEHRFIHEEGLAEEKTATYLLRISKHDEAMGHFLNAKKCYEVWGAHKLVQRVDKAIAILLPMCGRENAY